MSSGPQITMNVLRVLRVLLVAPEDERYGLELAREAGLRTATIYAILARLERARWLQSRWEADAPSELKRARQRLYRLTPLGEASARVAVAEQMAAFLGDGKRKEPLRPIPGVQPG
jgi:PadR family transcriptional regulator, regulatory protein PadR